ncbi:MAG: ABC transporter ATP-binding protein/permease [Lachnospiraceae bacterium]|nr:ABC transporter ATP-binding protein/permease [Lachnospiraceae bacterium]
MSIKKETIRRILPYIGKYWFFVLLSLSCAVISTVGSLTIPLLTGDGVDLILGKGTVSFSALTTILIQIGIVMGVSALGQWLMSLCNNHITYRMIKDIRQDAFLKLQSLPMSYADRHSTGDIVSRMVTDVETFADGLNMGFSQLFTGFLTIVGTLYFMLITNVPIALVVVILTPLSIVAARYITRKTYSMFQLQSQIRGEQTQLTEELLGNLKVVKAFSREKAANEEFESINVRLSQASLKATFFSSLTNPVTRFVNAIVYAGVAVLGAVAAIQGAVSVGRLSAFLSYANQYTKPFNEISGVFAELQNAIACASRIFEFIDVEPQIPDKEDATELVDAKGEVSLSHVFFRYEPERKLIEDFCLHVKPGQRVAIVGPTGCGKTTLINLLLRFYDVTSGTISMDGTDIRNLTRKSLRSSFGMVLQDTWLRQGTIRDNIAISRPGADPEEVIQAAKASHAHSFIKRLPQGYDTPIKEDGGNLSQGQKQLLCITRVMLHLPPMLILDEATSSIDTRTEQKIQKAFAKMMQGRTSFVVAHRLSTIKEADIILVMRDGDVVEQGTHESLLEKRGFYATLYESQFQME